MVFQLLSPTKIEQQKQYSYLVPAVLLICFGGVVVAVCELMKITADKTYLNSGHPHSPGPIASSLL